MKGLDLNFALKGRHTNSTMVSLPVITQLRSRVFIFVMAHHDDVIDEVTKQL